jgi:hypothetical protein
VFATTAARDSELQAAFRALPTFEKESRLTFDRLTEFAARHRPADHPAAPGGTRAVATLEDIEDIAPDLKKPARAAAAADRRVGARLPGRRAVAPWTCARCSASSTRRPPS